jgi:hypothetical protein
VRTAAIQELRTTSGADDVREHIKFEIAYHPQMWKERFNLGNGAAFGLSHNFWQVGDLRPKNRHKQSKNLCFTGASTHPGTGLPIVLLSAKLTIERILKEAGTISVQNLNYAANRAKEIVDRALRGKSRGSVTKDIYDQHNTCFQSQSRSQRNRDRR